MLHTRRYEEVSSLGYIVEECLDIVRVAPGKVEGRRLGPQVGRSCGHANTQADHRQLSNTLRLETLKD